MRTHRTDIRSETGASMVSYVLLAAGIAVTSIVSLGMLGRSTSDSFTEAGEQFDGGATPVAEVEVTETDDTDASVEMPTDPGATDDQGPSDQSPSAEAGGEGTAGGGAQGGGTAGGGGEATDSGGAASDDTDSSGTSTGSDDGSTDTGSDDGSTDTGNDDTGESGTPGGDDADGGSDEGSVEAAPDQEQSAGRFAEFSVSFEDWGGSLRVGSISGGAWRHEIVRDTGTRIHVEFTAPHGEQVLVKGWINSKGRLKTKVQDLDD